VARHLAKCFRTHSLTLSGFAGQPPGSGLKIDGWVKSVSDYIGALPSKRAIVVGHSLGGFLGLKVAAEYPDRIERLVLLDSLPYLPAAIFPGATVDGVRAQAERIREMLIAQPVGSFRAAQQATLRTMTANEDALTKLVDWSLQSDRRTIADAYYEMNVTDLRDSIAGIRAPTLVLVPWHESQKRDTAEVLATYQRQYQKLPGTRFDLIENSRHFLMIDQPQATNDAIDTFLSGCEPGVQP
jgi:pimeloyl-ACP methyl ester carboxylesterase